MDGRPSGGEKLTGKYVFQPCQKLDEGGKQNWECRGTDNKIPAGNWRRSSCPQPRLVSLWLVVVIQHCTIFTPRHHLPTIFRHFTKVTFTYDHYPQTQVSTIHLISSFPWLLMFKCKIPVAFYCLIIRTSDRVNLLGSFWGNFWENLVVLWERE